MIGAPALQTYGIVIEIGVVYAVFQANRKDTIFAKNTSHRIVYETAVIDVGNCGSQFDARMIAIEYTILYSAIIIAAENFDAINTTAEIAVGYAIRLTQAGGFVKPKLQIMKPDIMDYRHIAHCPQAQTPGIGVTIAIKTLTVDCVCDYCVEAIQIICYQ